MENTATATATLLSTQVAEEVRAMMARRRISGRKLAEMLDVSPSWVSYRMTGVTPIGLDDLQRIAAALDAEVADLLPRSNEGRIIVTAGSGGGHNQRSGHLAKRTRDKRTSLRPHPIGLPRTRHTAQTPAGPPSQRRPAVISTAD